MDHTEHAVFAQRSIRRLMVFFGLVYVVEGLAQAKVGVVWQPLNYFLKQTFGWTPVQISLSLAVLDLPWIIKPLYGLISDFVPLFGYRRRPYLVLANTAGAAAYAWVAFASTPGSIVFGLTLTSFAMAIASTLCGALLVENGQRFGVSGQFVTQQWLWFNVATVIAAVLGGGLTEWLSPAGALHAAALIAAATPLPVLFGAVMLVEEERAGIDWAELKRTLGSLTEAMRSRRLYVIGGFLFLYNFSPGFGTPLYFNLTDRLGFTQAYIGTLTAISGVGWIVGGLLHRSRLKRLSTAALLNLSIALGTAATLSYLLLQGPVSAALIYFAGGVAQMIATVATLTLAAEVCPKRSEGFVFAALTAITNLATPLADNVGSLLYERVFAGALDPLILVSAAATAAVFLILPFLKLRAGDPDTGLTGAVAERARD